MAEPGPVRVFVSHPADKLDLYYGARALSALRGIAEVVLNPQPRDLAGAELVDAAQGCDAVVAYRQTVADAAFFAGLPRLKALLRNAMDIRSIDVAAASAHGVLVTRASAGFHNAVAEWVLGAMIDLARGSSSHVQAYRRGEAAVPRMGRELRGSALGIVGYGGIGQRLGALAQALGMRVGVHTPQPVPGHAGVAVLPFDELLAWSDFVVCLAPALPETAGLFNAAAFAAMQPGAFFVNAARGELVDEAALLAALEGNRLAGAALDVGMAPDQMPSPALAAHPHVLATPHVGGLTRPAVEHQALETVAQLQGLLRGEMPAGAVNPEAAWRWPWPPSGPAPRAAATVPAAPG